MTVGTTTICFPKMSKELTIQPNNAIQPSKDPKFKPFVKPPAPTVLEEDDYVERMSRIIKRDFFPDLNKLNVQTQLLEALNHSDSARANQLSFRLAQLTGKTTHVAQTPRESNWETETVATTKTSQDEGLRLDEFHRKYTSEDNASFSEILEKNQLQQRLKYDYFYKGQGAKQTLSIQDQEKMTIEHISKPVITWNHETKSALIYGPNSLPLCPADLPQSRGPPKELNLQATRFKKPDDVQVQLKDSKISTTEAWRQMAKDTPGLFIPSNTPTVNGYKYVPSTPTLEPDHDIDSNELMTWGLIESTPILLDQGKGPSFSIAPTPKREILATELSNKASAALRKRQGSMKGSLGKRGVNSPALQLLQKNMGKQSGFGQALRSSYTTPKAIGTPGFTPLPSKRQTPKIVSNATETAIKGKDGSITDNLLNF